MPLEIFVPNTGQGDCTYIKFPNGKNMLVDINKTSSDVDIIEFLEDKIAKKYHSDIDKTCRRINYFVNTHPHEDHLRGIGELDNDDFYIDEIWETTHRLYVPASKKSEYTHYYDFINLVNKLKKRSSVRKLVAGRASFAKIGSSEVYVFGPSKYLVDSSSREDIHAQCGIMKIEYSDNSILFAGDSNRDNWEDRIVPHYSDDKVVNGIKQVNMLKSTILHASHHGSKYFFVPKNDDKDKYERSIDKIKPRFTSISVGKNNNHGHPHKIALDIYKDKTAYKRVFQTQDDKSQYFTFFSNSKVGYKKGLSYDQLVSIKPDESKSINALHDSTSVLSGFISEDIELDMPIIIPKTKREGYMKQ